MDTDGNIRCLMTFFPRTLLAAGTQTTEGKGVIGLFILFVIFVICGGCFGAAESGFSAMNKIRIKAKADEGNKKAKKALDISDNFDRALTTLLIGNNITHIAAASVATLIATRLFSDSGNQNTVTVLCTVITTLIVFLFSEMIPKAFANDRSETTALFSASSLKFLMKLLYPLATFFTGISKAATKITTRFSKSETAPSITEDELYDIIDTIEEEGVMDEEQGDLFKSALDFSETRAKDVMTMRNDVFAISASLSNEEILEAIQNTNHSRIPVYAGDLDHIIGTLQIRIFIREYRKNPKVKMRSLLIPPFCVSPDAMIDDLLTEMRQHKFYLGIVSDEKKKTLGIITIEDFLEELVGEIWDEDDVVDKNFLKLGGNRFQVNTHLTLAETCMKMETNCPHTLNGRRPLLSLILEHFGKIPEEEDSFTAEHLEFTVESVENGKIPYVVIRVLSPEELNALKTPEGGEKA